MHEMRTVAVDDPVAWASVSLSRGRAMQKALKGWRSSLEWRLSEIHRVRWVLIPIAMIERIQHIRIILENVYCFDAEIVAEYHL